MTINSEYRGFGLSYDDVVSSFNGADLDDFATNNKCGDFIIEREIELHETLLVSYLNTATQKLLEELDWFSVESVSISGQSTFEFPIIPDLNQDILVYVAENTCDGKYTNDRFKSSICVSEQCGDFDICPDSSDLEQIDIVVDEDGKYFGELSYQIGVNDKILLKYNPDKEQMDIPSLANVLRAMVCCTLGHNLFGEDDKVWSLVTHYCEIAHKAKEMVNNPQWLPPELKRLDYVNQVLPSGIRSVKLLRN